jgi:hypothetical protein
LQAKSPVAIITTDMSAALISFMAQTPGMTSKGRLRRPQNKPAIGKSWKTFKNWRRSPSFKPQRALPQSTTGSTAAARSAGSSPVLSKRRSAWQAT